MHLARFPRVHLAHLPTPLERMDRLSEALGGPEIWIKRDDCTGLSTGGNKTRKFWSWALAFLLIETFAVVQIVRGFFGNISADAYKKIDQIQKF